MHALTTTLPQISSLDQARGIVTSLFDELQQVRWRVAQLEKQLYGPSSERQESNLSKEQVLLSLFPPPAEPPATQEVLVPAEDKSAPRTRRQPGIKVLEAVTERI